MIPGPAPRCTQRLLPNRSAPQAASEPATQNADRRNTRHPSIRELWRIGSSSQRYEMTVGTRAANEAMVAGASSLGQTARANTIIGQCHKYQPYETSPIHTSGRSDKNLLTRLRS